MNFSKSLLFSFLVLITVISAVKTSYAQFPTTVFVRLSNFPRISPETDDTQRIRRAISSIGSGRVIFDEGTYEVSETIYLKSNLIIEGTSIGTGPYPPSSMIKMTAANKPLLMIGKVCNVAQNVTHPLACPAVTEELVSGTVVRDIGLSATSANGTIGILAEGSAYPLNTDEDNEIEIPASGGFHFEFNNVKFDGFHQGIKVQALDPGRVWQFDNVKLEHCVFRVPTSASDSILENKHTAVYVDSGNSGWRINSIEMELGQYSVGFNLQQIAYTNIDSMVANGPLQIIGNPPDSQPLAYASMFIKRHGSLKITNSVSEGVEYDLKVVEGNGLRYPLVIESNTFQNKVDIARSTVFSTANQFGLEYPYNGDFSQSPMPIARDDSQVYSLGDKFCFDNNVARCRNSGWKFENAGFMMFGAGQFANVFNSQTSVNNYFEVKRGYDSNEPDIPLISIVSTDFAPRPLLRLGVSVPNPGGTPKSYDYNYTLSRNSLNGYLDFVGNSPQPYNGYSFNGPVRLPTYTFANLPTSFGSGTLVFCADCQANSTPCAGGGGGALAISNNSSYICR